MILYEKKYVKQMPGGMAQSRTFSLDAHFGINVFAFGFIAPYGYNVYTYEVYFGPFRFTLMWR